MGLELVGRYIADDPDLSLLEMLESLHQQRLDVEALERSTETWTTAQLGVLAAFEFSWLKLDVKTQQVAELLSLFAPDVIPWGLVTSACQRLNWKKADRNKAKKQLNKNYLIQSLEDRESSYKIHPLIRQFLRVKLNLTSSASDLKQAFVAEMLSVAKTISDTPMIQDINLVSDAIPHLKEVAEQMISVVKDEYLTWAFVGITRFYQGQGLYALAEPWSQQCVATAQTRLGEDHPDVAISYNNLAALYECQGRYTEAEPLYQKALELCQRLLGEDHPDVAASYNNLAGLYFSQGRYTEAEPLLKKALAILEKQLGTEHPNTITARNNFEYLRNNMG